MYLYRDWPSCSFADYATLCKSSHCFLLILEHAGMAQAQCFSTEIFGCSGTSAGFRASGQDCCDDGFLAFNAGGDVCELCSGKVYKIDAWPFFNINLTLKFAQLAMW